MTDAFTPHSVYIAGPDVFFLAYPERAAEICLQCLSLGLQPVLPADAPGKASRDIYLGNMQRIRSCAAIVANVQAFRSAVEPDSGTAFEIGGFALQGKPVAMWLPPEQSFNYRDRVATSIGVTEIRTPDGKLVEVDAVDGHLLENFGSPLNLMLAESGVVHTNSLDALRDVRDQLLALTPRDRPGSL